MSVNKATFAGWIAAATVALSGCATQPPDPVQVCEVDGCYVYPNYAYRSPYYGYWPFYGAFSYWGGYGYYGGGSRQVAPPVASAPGTPLPPDTRVVPLRPSPPPGASPDRRYPLGGSPTTGSASGGSGRSGGGGSLVAPRARKR